MTALAPSMQAYFTDRLIAQRRASPNTITAYRHTFRMLLRFITERTSKPPSTLDITDLDAPLIAAFLDHLEHDRNNTVATRNNRLATIHSLFAYLALHHPEHANTIQRVLAIPAKRTERNLLTYLTDAEVHALLAACDQTTWTGRRDHAMLALTIQTGLRISELIALNCQDITLATGANVHTIGKGRKTRRTPLTPATGACSKPGSPNAPALPTSRCFRPAPAHDSAATPSSTASRSTSTPPPATARRSRPSTSPHTRSGTPPRCVYCSPATTSP
jgi:integrase/recombinase XerD